MRTAFPTGHILPHQSVLCMPLGFALGIPDSNACLDSMTRLHDSDARAQHSQNMTPVPRGIQMYFPYHDTVSVTHV